MLLNMDFEGGFSIREAPEVEIARGWDCWYSLEKPTDVEDPEQPGYNMRPEWKSEDYNLGQIHSGRFSQKQFNVYATHTAGLLQTVESILGQIYEFSIWFYCWSSQFDSLSSSKEDGNYRISIAIDPYGQHDWTAPEVIWGQEHIVYDKFYQLKVQARAKSDSITVITRGRPQYRVKHNFVWWDDAKLIPLTEEGVPIEDLATLSTKVAQLETTYLLQEQRLRTCEGVINNLVDDYGRWAWLVNILRSIFQGGSK